jgi:excisionase family DNA binding protein
MEKEKLFNEFEDLITLDEAKDALRVCRMTLFRLRREKKIKHVKIGRRVYLRPKDLRALMEEAVA